MQKGYKPFKRYAFWKPQLFWKRIIACVGYILTSDLWHKKTLFELPSQGWNSNAEIKSCHEEVVLRQVWWNKSSSLKTANHKQHEHLTSYVYGCVWKWGIPRLEYTGIDPGYWWLTKVNYVECLIKCCIYQWDNRKRSAQLI